MDQEQQDAGTIAALIERTRSFRLPRAQRLLERVDAGEPLGEADIAFLKRVYADTRSLGPLVERNPDYQSLVVRMLGLYTEIIQKGLRNEPQ